MTPSARDDVLGRIRAALIDRPTPTPVRRDYRAGGVQGAELVDLLTDRLRDYRARVRRVAPDEVADAVAAARRERGAVRLAVAAGVPAHWAPDAIRDDETMTAADLDGLDGVLTACTVAIAETGTIVLDHAAPDQGQRALTLVPDYHLVVVRTEQIVGSVPEAIARLIARHPQTWISGPSATSDIELERVEGVHGPRTLEVLIT